MLRRSIGKEYNICSFGVPSSMWACIWVSQNSTFQTTTVTAVAGFRLQPVESNDFFRRESILLFICSDRAPISLKGKPMCLEYCSNFGILFQTDSGSPPKGNLYFSALENNGFLSGSCRSIFIASTKTLCTGKTDSWEAALSGSLSASSLEVARGPALVDSRACVIGNATC